MAKHNKKETLLTDTSKGQQDEIKERKKTRTRTTDKYFDNTSLSPQETSTSGTEDRSRKKEEMVTVNIVQYPRAIAVQLCEKNMKGNVRKAFYKRGKAGQGQINENDRKDMLNARGPLT